MRCILLLVLLMPAQEAEIPELIHRLESESAQIRGEATRSLRALGEAALPDLRRALDHKDPEVRARVADLLRQFEWEGTLNPRLLTRYPALSEAFGHGDPAAVLAFGEAHPSWIGGLDSDFEAYAVKLLDSSDPVLQEKAVRIVWQIATLLEGHREPRRRPISQLLTLLSAWDPEACEDPDRNRLYALTEALLSTSSSQDRSRLLEAAPVHADARLALELVRAAAGIAPSQPALITTLERGPVWSKPLASKVIGRLHFTPARPAVLRLLQDPGLHWMSLMALDGMVDASCEGPLLEAFRKVPLQDRSWVWFERIQKIGTAPALRMLLELLDSTDDQQRKSAASALGSMKARESIEPLFRNMDNPKTGPVFAAALGQAADAAAARKLLDLLDLPAGDRRNHALIALHGVALPEAHREVLGRLRSEKRPELRRELLDIVTGYGFLSAGGDGVDAALEGIAAQTSDPLSGEASLRLAWMNGKAGVRKAEDAFLGAEAPPARLLEWLAQFPSDRLVDRVVRLCLEKRDEGWGLPYLEQLGTEKARRELARIRAELKLEPPAPLLSQGSAELLALLRDYEKNRKLPDPKDEIVMICGTGVFIDRTGPRSLVALAAKADRSLEPLFLERLKDPDYEQQHSAMEGLAALKSLKAVPELKRIVLSSEFRTRARAIRALAKIGAPGTADFLKSVLRDNPQAAPFALARLGVDARTDVAGLLEDRVQLGPILGALDQMENPGVYGNLDAPLNSPGPMILEAFMGRLEKATGVPCRLSAGLRALLRAGGERAVPYEARTLRDALEDLQGALGYENYATVFRNGAIELGLVDEALAFRASRPPGK